MSGKAGFQAGEHGAVIPEGVTTAISWLTVIPLRGATAFDRITGARAMAALPVVGAVLGAATLAVAWLLQCTAMSPILIGAIVVALWELATRGMHLDGLADVGDALASYAPPEKAREILRDQHAGALGMGAVVVTLIAQVAGVASLVGSHRFGTVALIPVIARLAAMVPCTTQFRPFAAGGFGGLVIGTLHPWWVAGWWLVIAICGWPLAGAAAGWVGAAVCAIGWLLSWHCSRRFGGLNGDCIGTVIAVGAAAAGALLAA